MNLSQEQKVIEISCHILGTSHSVITKFPTESLVISHIIVIAFNVILIIPTILLNGAAAITILKCYQLKKKPCYFIILLQSVNDLAVGVLGIPSFIYFLSTGIGSASNCIIATLALRSTVIPLATSNFTLFLLTMERYIAILHPFAYSTLVTNRQLLIFVGTSAVIMFTVSVLSLAFDGFLGIFKMILATTIFLFIAFAYTRISFVIRKLARSEKKPQDAASENNMKERKLFLQEFKQAKACFIIIICSFVLSYLPKAVAVPLTMSATKSEKLASLTCGVTIGLCNSSFNSVIFYWTKTLLRKETFKTLKGIREYLRH